MSVFLHTKSDKGAGEIAINFAINTRGVFGGVMDGSLRLLAGMFKIDKLMGGGRVTTSNTRQY